MNRRPLHALLFVLAVALPGGTPFAEYGDVVLNKRSEANGEEVAESSYRFQQAVEQRAAWLYRRFHDDLGFEPWTKSE